MRTHRMIAAVAAALLVGAAGAEAQGTSTTSTKTTTTTNTTTKSWKSPDGNKGGSSSTTTTSTRSQSTTIGRPSSGSRPAPGLPNPNAVPGIQWMAGAWNASDGKGKSCLVTLYANMSSGGGATSTGCRSDINGIGNWSMTGNTLTLVKNFFSTAATLRQTGPSRFDGITASGAPIAIWR